MECSERGAMASDITVLLLGAAQDGGYPQFGCWCDNCSAAYTNPTLCDTAVSLAIIEHSTQRWWLVDASPQLNQQWARFATYFDGLTLAGVILTHAHTGHYCGLHYFGKECHNATALPLYASQSMHTFLQQHEPWAVMYRNRNFVPVVIESNIAVHLGEQITLRPVSVTHRADFTDTFAFSIIGRSRKLFYCPDIDHWRDLCIVEFATHHDIMLLDATFYDNYELPQRDMSLIPHPRVVDTINILTQSEEHACACDVVLIHMNHTNALWRRDVATVEKLAKLNVTIGIQGMKWNI